MLKEKWRKKTGAKDGKYKKIEALFLIERLIYLVLNRVNFIV